MMWWGTIVVCLSSIGICDLNHAIWLGQSSNGTLDYHSCYYSGMNVLMLNARDIVEHFQQNTYFVYDIICGVKA